MRLRVVAYFDFAMTDEMLSTGSSADRTLRDAAEKIADDWLWVRGGKLDHVVGVHPDVRDHGLVRWEVV